MDEISDSEHLECTDDELIKCAEEVEWMDDADDAILVAAMDLAFRKLEPWEEARNRVWAMLKEKPEMEDIYRRIDEIRPFDEWPSMHYNIFHGVTDLTRRPRFRIMLFAWYNGIYPKWIIEWFRFMGSYTLKPERERELLELYKELEKRAESFGGRKSMENWKVFCMDKKEWVRCEVKPTEEEYKKHHVPDWD
jgi:hypothetical protein